MDVQQILVSNPADREAVAAILFKNGYTVRLGKVPQGKRTVLYVEFWREKTERCVNEWFPKS